MRDRHGPAVLYLTRHDEQGQRAAAAARASRGELPHTWDGGPDRGRKVLTHPLPAIVSWRFGRPDPAGKSWLVGSGRRGGTEGLKTALAGRVGRPSVVFDGGVRSARASHVALRGERAPRAFAARRGARSDQMDKLRDPCGVSRRWVFGGRGKVSNRGISIPP